MTSAFQADYHFLEQLLYLEEQMPGRVVFPRCTVEAAQSVNVAARKFK